MHKLDLTRVTAICVDGRPQTAESLDKYRIIVKYMMAHVEFAEIKLLLTTDPQIDNTTFIQIPQMGISEYSNFCIRDMHRFIETDFCLIFQDDGFILNPALWSDDFFKYDYIGAPWPLYIGWPVEGRQVGNGGFSLRSRALLQFIKNLDSGGNEDVLIACVHRDRLDSAGLTFAPVEVARAFAVEIPLDASHTPDKTFGFHAKHLVDQAFSIIEKRTNL